MSTNKHPHERFFKFVKKTKKCWLWTGFISDNGYGRFRFENHQSAHRASYILHHGEIQKGLYVLHRCDVKRCVNPEHLYVGTPMQNVIDHCTRGTGNRGSANGRAKLNPKKVDRIRFLAKQGWSRRRLACKYGVVKSTINWVVGHGTWSHSLSKA